MKTKKRGIVGAGTERLIASNHKIAVFAEMQRIERKREPIIFSSLIEELPEDRWPSFIGYFAFYILSSNIRDLNVALCVKLIE